jgi:hypothetical protein
METETHYIMRSFIIRTHHQILLREIKDKTDKA